MCVLCWEINNLETNQASTSAWQSCWLTQERPAGGPQLLSDAGTQPGASAQPGQAGRRTDAELTGAQRERESWKVQG